MAKPSFLTIIYGLIFLLFVLSIVWFLRNFEYVTEDIDIGYQGKAKYNALYAAQKFVEKMGIPSESSRSVNKLNIETLNLQDTVVLKQSSFALAEFHVERMLHWVSQGGHLILDSYTLHSQDDDDDEIDDYFLHHLKIKQYEHDSDEIEDSEPHQFNWQGYKLEVKFDPHYYFETEQFTNSKIQSSNGTHLLSFIHGNGRVTVLSDTDFIKNKTIAKYDHAQFLWHLVNFENRLPHKVWFILTAEAQFPSLSNLLWEHAKWLVISGSILLIIWLWHISRRFGSILPIPAKSRRRLLEHIEASGHFLWQQKQAHYLLHQVQQQTWKRLAIVHPQWLHLPQDKLCQHLSDITHIQVQEIRQALQLAQTSEQAIQIQLTEIDFTRAIQVFNMIRKVL
ncbi:DUF4350 domain-containing protein [Candidatus Albibeggiatoa sp. nov. BB20]|uniref:DUF4350 domain-containing protein n=1 Tax=Candidatus Albibeggiatoa sp. nov. BB20 TaxID=3162723 RepID=UPI003365607C